MNKHTKKSNGSVQGRLGLKAHEEIESIKDERLRNGKSKERLSTEKITNLIVSNRFWKEIKKEIINAPEEDVEKYGG